MLPARRSCVAPARTVRRRLARLLCPTIVVLLATVPVAAKRKDDKIVLENGDRIVGEIKELAQGELRFSNSYILETFHLDWSRIRELESQDTYRVEVRDGRHLHGTIARHDDGTFIVGSGAAAETFPWSDIVAIVPIDTSFWAQLTGQVSSGFSFTSSDEQTQFSASGSVGYIAEHYAFDLSGSGSFNRHSDDNGGVSSRRIAADLVNEYPIAPRWFAVGLLGFLSSDQQDLDLRTTVGGGVGRWVRRTAHTRITTFGGLVYTHEQYTIPADDGGESQVGNNLEGVASLQYAFHRFKTTDIVSKLTIYPSLSSPGRVRLSMGPTLNFEIAHNLYWTFTLYENYDTHPPANANKNDFGVTNSLGWKF
jgi:putative salt-induced outer membrane protein YdiY